MVEDLSAEQEGAKAPCMEESYDAGLKVDTGYKKCGEVQLNVSVEELVDERTEINDITSS